jgi:hypothetical protein
MQILRGEMHGMRFQIKYFINSNGFPDDFFGIAFADKFLIYS